MLILYSIWSLCAPSTAYDEATIANLSVGRQLADRHIALLAEDATRDNLMALLKQSKEEPLFTMSHGKYDKLLDNNRKPAITLVDRPLFINRVVYVWACHTGTNLGKKIAFRNKGIWWGYTGAVTAPSISEPFRQKQQEVFRFIQDHFDKAVTKEDILNLLNDIKDKCDQMLSFFDEQMNNYPDADLFEIYSCSQHIWERLRVWHSSDDEPLMHEESQGLLLD